MAEEKSDWDMMLDAMNEEHQRRREGKYPLLDGRGPTWAGVGSVGFLALIGGLVGAFLARGLAGAIVGAILFGVGTSVVKLGFGGAHLDRPAMAKRTAIGAVVGLILTFVVGAVSAFDLSLFLGTMIGAAGGMVSHLYLTHAKT